MYDDTKLLMTAEPVKDYIPYSWVSMATVKAQYYMALAHTHMATAIIEFAGEWEGTLKSCQHKILIPGNPQGLLKNKRCIINYYFVWVIAGNITKTSF